MAYNRDHVLSVVVWACVMLVDSGMRLESGLWGGLFGGVEAGSATCGGGGG